MQRAERRAPLDDEASAARAEHRLDQLERAVDQRRVTLPRAAGGAGERQQVGGGEDVHGQRQQRQHRIDQSRHARLVVGGRGRGVVVGGGRGVGPGPGGGRGSGRGAEVAEQQHAVHALGTREPPQRAREDLGGLAHQRGARLLGEPMEARRVRQEPAGQRRSEQPLVPAPPQRLHVRGEAESGVLRLEQLAQRRRRLEQVAQQLASQEARRGVALQ